ncbi:hypothetical protein EJ08DRAFT_97125 [Tothia fuscella]|uniref:Uncharacterized protein n=1 Tax=Tothia fuscella TaxID=1048955 RepID=A0A9P4NXN4_9PEZI|nr:hypothetical protein EJ08DRAFT_97125 [Tothia fuscella]
MLDYDSIKSFAAKVSGLDHLDIAILNAGMMAASYSQSPYGWEKTLQVNVLSTTLLALRLLPILRASKTPNSTPPLEIVSSGLHTNAQISSNFESAPLQAYNDPKNFSFQPQYGKSKFFVQCAVRAIANREEPKGGEALVVIVTSLCSGACKSELGRELSNPVVRVLMKVFNFIFMRSTEEGSRTLVSGAVLGSKAHGRFWQHDRIADDAPNLTGDKGERLQEAVWHDIINALIKDVLEVTQLARG